jgi:serine/threonine protein kinase
MEANTILADRYQILEQLNHKTSRQTFLARDFQSQDLVVIKILHFNADFKWDDLKLFEREASTLQNLHHPAIPQYLDYFDLDYGFALVQTYIDAPSLETVIQSGRKFSEVEVVELADRILSILTYLHDQLPPVIHRDIKPSNILLGNRSGNSIGDVYLVDFGSVQTAASTDGGTITIVGTAGYIPLEQFSGKTVIASDLYSLGMTAIYLLTGVHPTELTQVNGHFKFTAEISNRLLRWVEKMTQPYLDKRFDSARLAQIALTSEDGNYGDFNHLKPTYTQVQLYRDREKIEIVWNDNNREKIEVVDKLCGILLLGCPIGFCLTIIMNLLASLFSGFLALGPCLMIGSFISLMVAGIVSINLKLSKKTNYKLAIDGEYIYRCKYQSKQQTFKILSRHPRSEIEILAYNPGYSFNRYFTDNNTLVQGEVTVDPQLYLCCGDFEYNFYNRLSKVESLWIGRELSNFLDLELQIIYPTPKVPAETTCGGGC